MHTARALARMTTERRRSCRREQSALAVLASHYLFDREERVIWKQLERRRLRRRHQDLQRALVTLTER